MRWIITCCLILQGALNVCPVRADDVKDSATYARIKASIDAVSAIDTHEHLSPFDLLHKQLGVGPDKDLTLWSIFQGSYYTWTNPLEPWPKDNSFDTWWTKAQHNFQNAKATSFYRYLLPAFKDLYGVDFDTVTAKQAKEINRRIGENYKNDQWHAYMEFEWRPYSRIHSNR